MKNVLICDDCCINRIVIKKIIGNDYNVYEAYDFLTCIEIIKNCNIDILFLDLVLTGFDGIDVLVEINRMNLINKIHIIIVSGEDNFDIMKWTSYLGSNSYIIKPVTALKINEALSYKYKGKEISNNLVDILLISKVYGMTLGLNSLHICQSIYCIISNTDLRYSLKGLNDACLFGILLCSAFFYFGKDFLLVDLFSNKLIFKDNKRKLKKGIRLIRKINKNENLVYLINMFEEYAFYKKNNRIIEVILICLMYEQLTHSVNLNTKYNHDVAINIIFTKIIKYFDKEVINIFSNIDKKLKEKLKICSLSRNDYKLFEAMINSYNDHKDEIALDVNIFKTNYEFLKEEKENFFIFSLNPRTLYFSKSLADLLFCDCIIEDDEKIDFYLDLLKISKDKNLISTYNIDIFSNLYSVSLRINYLYDECISIIGTVNKTSYLKLLYEKLNYDYDKVIDLYKNEDIIITSIQYLIEDECFNNIILYYNNKNFNKAFYHIHRFKGIVSNLFLTSLINHSCILIDFCKQNFYDTKIITSFIKEYQNFVDSFSKVKNSIDMLFVN